jgi:hypothetical protein
MRNKQDGQRRMQALVFLLESWIVSGGITANQLQPWLAPFFLSGWWYVQAPQQWPVLTFRVRGVLLPREEISEERMDCIQSYFEFRRRFISLAAELGISSWALEHLCFWYGQRGLEDRGEEKSGSSHPNTDSQHAFPWERVCLFALQAEGKRGEVIVKGFEEKTPQQSVISYRTHVQWLLAKIGKKVGCRVWIAAGDQSKVYQRERLGDLSLTSLPVLAAPAFQRIIRQSDVLWLLDNEVVAAYEIERAHPDISTSLLRLYVLGARSVGREVSLCVVAPQNRFEKVRFELSRSAFREYGLRRRCTLISEEQLLQHEEHILRWASGPSVIKDLTSILGVGEQR